ncbi:MAG: FAD synthetase [Pseudochelatococcus sp.]|jgi:riboflavin kinase/FMN adenylyltransferase|uniref:FAD synthetase n=1 Tax=Pseudochelatococcus sp. TaxID=2020869 RepID=UPI003D933994
MEIGSASARPQVHADGELTLSASVVTIGAFDGVHRGHQALIRQAVAAARASGTPSVVWTFDPPPKAFFGRAEQLTTLAEKLDRIAFWQPDHIVVTTFDETYRKRSAGAFLNDVARLNPSSVWVGGDFRFGAGQAGDVALLARTFDTRLHAPVLCDEGEIVSSSRIRQLRARGMVDAAETLLGWFGPCTAQRQ